MCVYLIHFSTPYKQAQHYLGYTHCDLDERIAAHRENRGARLLQVVNDAGIAWEVVRVWMGAGREVEQKYKRAQHNKRLCPVCREQEEQGL